MGPEDPGPCTKGAAKTTDVAAGQDTKMNGRCSRRGLRTWGDAARATEHRSHEAARAARGRMEEVAVDTRCRQQGEARAANCTNAGAGRSSAGGDDRASRCGYRLATMNTFAAAAAAAAVGTVVGESSFELKTKGAQAW